jgi:hypothetical protein
MLLEVGGGDVVFHDNLVNIPFWVFRLQLRPNSQNMRDLIPLKHAVFRRRNIISQPQPINNFVTVVNFRTGK